MVLETPKQERSRSLGKSELESTRRRVIACGREKTLD